MRTPRFVVVIAWILTALSAVDQFAEFNKITGPGRFIPTLLIGVAAIAYFIYLIRRRRPDGRARFKHLRPMLVIGIAAAFVLLVLPASVRLYRDVIHAKWLEPPIISSDVSAYLVRGVIPERGRTEQRKRLLHIVRAAEAVKNGHIDEAKLILAGAEEHEAEPHNVIASFADLVRGMILGAEGQFEGAIDTLQKVAAQTNYKRDPAHESLFARANVELAWVYTRKFEGSPNADHVALYDKAIETYRAAGATEAVVEMMRRKVDTLKRVAYASTKPDAWKLAEAAADESVAFAKKTSPGKGVVLAQTNLLGTLYQYYSQIVDDGEPTTANEVRRVADKIQSVRSAMRTEFVTHDVGMDLRRRARMNEILFDMFVAEPTPELDLAELRRELRPLEPPKIGSDYQIRAQWLQLAGLIDLKAGDHAAGAAKLEESLSIWHSHKDFFEGERGGPRSTRPLC